MSRRGLYFYGFTRPGAADGLAVPGVDGPDPVVAVDLGGIAAVVSGVDLDAFEAAASDRPDPDWLVPRALAHERVVEAILARSPVLPVRFGTLYNSADSLAALVAGQRDAIARFLDHVADKQEWSIKGYIDIEQGVDRILAVDPDFAPRQAALPVAPGVRYFREKKLREEARRHARQSARALADRVRERVESAAVETRVLAPRPADAPGREAVLNLACLVREGSIDTLLALAGDAADPGDGPALSLVPTGPWPPYHFCPTLGETPT